MKLSQRLYYCNLRNLSAQLDAMEWKVAKDRLRVATVPESLTANLVSSSWPPAVLTPALEDVEAGGGSGLLVSSEAAGGTTAPGAGAGAGWCLLMCISSIFSAFSKHRSWVLKRHPSSIHSSWTILKVVFDSFLALVISTTGCKQVWNICYTIFYTDSGPLLRLFDEHC